MSSCFSGLRLTLNTSWLGEKDWPEFMAFEKKVQESIFAKKIIALCQYDLTECGTEKAIDIMEAHPGVLVRRNGEWTLVKSSSTRISESKLRESEKLYRSLIENSLAGVLIVDDNFTFCYVNDRLCSLLGYPKDKIIGKDFRSFLDEESLSLVSERYIRRQKGEDVPSQCEFNVVRKDGSKRRVEISSSVIRDFWNSPRTIAQLIDVTEKKKAEEMLLKEKVFLNELFEATLAAIIMADNEKEIVKVNKEFTKLFGFSKEDALSKNIDDLLIPEKDRKDMAKLYSQLDRGKSVVFEAVRKGKTATYTRRLVDHLYAWYLDPKIRIDIEIDVKDVYLDINRAIPCGLIINELVSNALKHAFPGKNRGKICILFTSSYQDKKKIYHLKIKDNGTGIKEKFDINKPQNLGLQIVVDLVNQLEGDISFSVNNWTEFEIVF